MTLWWLGNLVLLAVVIPAVIMVLSRTLKPALEIKKHADEILKYGALILGELDAIPELLRTQELVETTSAGLARYGGALDRIL